MALTTDIVASYRRPRAVLRSLQGDRREARILVYLMLACALIFVAQWPRLARDAHMDETIPLDALLSGALFAWIFIAPLAFYALGGMLSLVLRIAGPVDAFAVRLGLFWALLVAAPLMLFQGLVAGLIGPGLQANLAGLPAAVAFFAVLIAGLRVALEAPHRAA
ncbi:YIP1 family protein [Pararhodobacter zhoushanensis]|uniref:YIP1 family protein n=1 Tax=Pararhodobacter zhoushanensis TaxID=2479545 RepID=A0ABT3H1K7_9RHOB|nr:YIP1 family protein [Pararhodobacter zhoushanensis]MCW1933716.1 YIP1 family protein [Pararhodobacter zhoushanensis]